MLKLERMKDYLLMEEEFVMNQERSKPQDVVKEVSTTCQLGHIFNKLKKKKKKGFIQLLNLYLLILVKLL